jgi:hypothetical protein
MASGSSTCGPLHRGRGTGGASGWLQDTTDARFLSPAQATSAQPGGLPRCTSARGTRRCQGGRFVIICARVCSAGTRRCLVLPRRRHVCNCSAATGAHAVRHPRERGAPMERVAWHIVSRSAQSPDERLPREKGRPAPFLLAGVQGQRPAGGAGGNAPAAPHGAEPPHGCRGSAPPGCRGRAPPGCRGQRPRRGAGAAPRSLPAATLPHSDTATAPSFETALSPALSASGDAGQADPGPPPPRAQPSRPPGHPCPPRSPRSRPSRGA